MAFTDTEWMRQHFVTGRTLLVDGGLGLS